MLVQQLDRLTLQLIADGCDQDSAAAVLDAQGAVYAAWRADLIQEWPRGWRNPEARRRLSGVPGKPGRPRAPVPGASLSLYLRAPEVDTLARLALRQGVSVSAVARTMLRRELRELREGATEKLEKL